MNDQLTDEKLRQVAEGCWDYPNPTPGAVVSCLAAELLECRKENERLNNDCAAMQRWLTRIRHMLEGKDVD